MPEVDGLRGLAILLVSIYRFSKEIPANTWDQSLVRSLLGMGEFGVDLFFVLSGFLITGILVENKRKSIGLGVFYARRSLRIFPLYFLSLIVFLWLVPMAWGTLSPFQAAEEQQFFLWTHTANLKMCFENAWCFGPLDHFWSLAVEEHFYLLWPILVLALPSKTLLRFALVFGCAMTLARVGYAFAVPGSVCPAVFTLFRADALCMGAAIAVWLREYDHALRPSHWPKCIVILFVLVAIPLAILQRQLLTLPNIVWMVAWSAFLILLLRSHPASGLATTMRFKFLRTLGKYSYAMYLFQAPLIPLLASVVSYEGIRLGVGSHYLAGCLYVIAMMFFTFGAALLSWNLLEKHFLQWKPTGRICCGKLLGPAA